MIQDWPVAGSNFNSQSQPPEEPRMLSLKMMYFTSAARTMKAQATRQQSRSTKSRPETRQRLR